MALAWHDGVSFTAEAALSAATGSYGAWDAALWSTATWGPDTLWVDVSQWLREPLNVDRQFSREIQIWEAGRATLNFKNDDSRFSPANLAGPYVTAGVTQVRPWRPMRVRVTYRGVTYQLYNGYALDFIETWTKGPPSLTRGRVAVPCIDEYGQLARFDGLEQSAIGGGETTGRRIHRVLDNAGHTGARNIAAGVVTVQPTTLAQNAVSDLALTTDTEGGSLFVDADGTVVFEDRYSLIEATRSNTIQATFGDGAGELPCRDIVTAYRGDLVKNIAAFARVGGQVQIAADLTSRALYGDSRYPRTDLIAEADPQVQALAEFYVQRFKDPELTVSQIEIRPRRDPVRLFPQVLGRRVRDLVRVVKRAPGGVTITRDCHIAGIHHEITRQNWVTTFDLWSATPYTSYVTSRWDVATWDGATWFY